MTDVTRALADFASYAVPPDPVSRAVASLLDGSTPVVAPELGRYLGATVPGLPPARDRTVALAIGWEITVRVHETVAADLEGGWDAASPALLAGAAAMAGRAFGSGVDLIATALSIAVTQVSGFAALAGDDLGRHGRRHAVERGVEAMRLAEAGLTAPWSVLEGRRGAVSVLAPKADAHRAIDDLGRVWRIVAYPSPIAAAGAGAEGAGR